VEPEPPAQQAVSIHRKLLTGLIVTIGLLSGTLLLISFSGARQAVQLLSSDVIEQTTSEMEARLEQFLGPPRRGLSVVRAWVEDGLLPLESPLQVNRMLMPMMREFPQISTIVLADAHGRETMLLRRGDTWVNRHSHPQLWGSRARWMTWRDGGEVTEAWRETGYDARTRPWFQGAMAAPGRNHWTRPYEFFTVREPGVTVAQAFPVADGEIRVLAFDLLLRDISGFTMTLTAGRNGRVFVLTDDDRVVGLPSLAHFQDRQRRREALLKRPQEIGVALVRDTANAIRRGGNDGEPVRFRSAGANWWAASRPFPLGLDRTLRMMVAVPEADLVADLTRLRYWILAITTLAIAFGVWQATVLARQLASPIASLAADSDRIAAGDLSSSSADATGATSGISELSRLARAHEQMRAALRTLLKLERDLQIAREIQQSTFPQRIPQLAGYTVAAYSDPAEETGGDTFDVIGIRDDGAGGPRVVQEDPQRLLLLLADATGHGIGPALSVTQVRAMLRMAVRTGAALPSIVQHLNQQLCDDLSRGRNITAWLGELHAREDGLHHFSAGQGPLLHVVAASDSVRRLRADAPPLGLLDDLVPRLSAPLALAEGDLFAVISDGVFEAQGHGDEMFGVERVEALLRAHIGESADVIMQRLRQALAAFCTGRPPQDDCTAIIIKREG
jgi:serine phosphatase RsbU (regulator of sigma subunit)